MPEERYRLLMTATGKPRIRRGQAGLTIEQMIHILQTCRSIEVLLNIIERRLLLKARCQIVRLYPEEIKFDTLRRFGKNVRIIL